MNCNERSNGSNKPPGTRETTEEKEVGFRQTKVNIYRSMLRNRPVTPTHVMIAKGNDKAVKSVSIVPSVAVKSTDDTYAYINRAAINPITTAFIFFFK